MSARRTTARLVALPTAVLGFTALAAAPALAHVSISPDEGAANAYTVATLSVPHGCDGSPTTKITIRIPDELLAVTPTRNPLWEVTKTMKKLDTPITGAHGDEVTEKVDTVVYEARTPLPDGFRDAFELSFQVPDVAGTALAFPVIQECVQGETAWTEVVAEGEAEPEHPAPVFTVTAGTADGHGGTPIVESAASDDDAASKGLAYTGLGVGALGLLTAVGALARGRKQS